VQPAKTGGKQERKRKRERAKEGGEQRTGAGKRTFTGRQSLGERRGQSQGANGEPDVGWVQKWPLTGREDFLNQAKGSKMRVMCG